MYVMYMMVRKQLYLEAAQDRALKRRARALGVSEAEVVRAALDMALTPGLMEHADPPRPGHERALRAVLEGCEEIARARTGPTLRWTREELYEERESRRSAARNGRS